MEEQNIDYNEFVPIIGYEGHYEINRIGVIKGLKYCTILKPHLRNGTGYYFVMLSKNGFKRPWGIHRLLAIHFIPNPENKPTVNHINAIRHDFTLCNLEWATFSENNKHAFKIGNKSNSRGKNAVARVVIDLYTGIFYDCIHDLSDSIGINYAILRTAISSPHRYKLLRERFAYA